MSTHWEEDCGESGHRQPRHQARVGGLARARVQAGGRHQDDQQRVEEGCDALCGQRAPE